MAGTHVRVWGLGLVLLAVYLFSGCGGLPSDGASRSQVLDAPESDHLLGGIQLVTVDDAVTRKLMAGYKSDLFSEVFGPGRPQTYLIGPGDVLEVSIWEAAPAMLFGGLSLDLTAGAGTRAEILPPQMVMEDGKINVPFAGRISVAGRSIRAIEADISQKLQGQANNPQVTVNVTKNNSSNVTVIGDTNRSAQVPLTPKGERLLDVIAAVGGVSQPVNRMSVRLSRRSVTATMPLDSVIRNPVENITLRPGDVVTALFQPKTFSVLGAAGRNQEIPFEAQGISLAQALARSGGLDDRRADARGVFIFRFEEAFLASGENRPVPAADGAVPVVYQVDLRDPASFFVTQNFPMRDRDVLYVATAPAAELEKFLRLIGTVLSPAMSTTTFINRLE